MMLGLTYILELFNTIFGRRESYDVKTVNENGPIIVTEKTGEVEKSCVKRRHIIAFMGFLITFLINAHRMNLSIAIVAMVNLSDLENRTLSKASEETTKGLLLSQNPPTFKWTLKTQGYILGSAFVGTVLLLLISGKIVETYGPRTTLIWGTLVSSLCTLVTPFAAYNNAYILLLVQFVRGCGQAFMFTAVAVLSANWFPRAERGQLNGFIISGTSLGFIVGAVLTSFICDNISIGGWPTAFYVFGAAGMFILILQYFYVHNLPKEDPKISDVELKFILKNQESALTLKRPDIPWRKIFTSMSTYALFYGMIGQYWAGSHFLLVNATFLSTVLHYPMAQNGILNSMPYIISMIVSILTGYLSTWLYEKDYLSVDKLRKMWNFIGCCIYSLCLVVMIVSNYEGTAVVISCVVGIASIGFQLSSIMLVPVDMSPTFAGTLMALSTAVGMLSGFTLPFVLGALINKEQALEQWNKFYIICIAVVLSSGIFFGVFGSAEIQAYNSTDSTDTFHKTEDTIPTELVKN